jgi:hypothetical protein
MTRAHGLPSRLSVTWSRYCSYRCPRYPLGVGHRADELRDPGPEALRERRQRGGGRAAQLLRMVLDRVVQQRGGEYLDVVDPVVADDPDGDPEQVVDVRLADPYVVGVQLARQRERLLQPYPVGGREPRDLQCEPLPQSRFAIDLGHRVQRHRLQETHASHSRLARPATAQ